MYRSAMETLKEWKNKSTRKPLVIRGARQVGKTWLMKEFGNREFKDAVYINFDGNEAMRNLFEGTNDISRIIMGLEIFAGRKIDSENTLLIFDEIQEVPRALSALKYFNENAPQYHITCAGSMLGIAMYPGASFPVGKVEFLDLHPLSFKEFLMAFGMDEYSELLRKGDYHMAGMLAQEFVTMLRLYYYIGGMPEVVHSFVGNKDFKEAREIQLRIMAGYEQDFSKHAPNDEVPRIRMIWNSIPQQLSRESRKFVYGLLKEGARAREFEHAMMWLTDCGLVQKVHRASKPGLPLKAYEDPRAFKVFFLDVGLLSCMAGLRQGALLQGSALFEEFKGALTEQYVFQQLRTLQGINIFYWSAERATAEVDFVIDNGKLVVPIEVKFERNLKSKSLKVYKEKFEPVLAIRASMAEFSMGNGMLELPLWAVSNIETLINDLDSGPLGGLT